MVVLGCRKRPAGEGGIQGAAFGPWHWAAGGGVFLPCCVEQQQKKVHSNSALRIYRQGEPVDMGLYPQKTSCARKASLRRTGVHCTCGLTFSCGGRDGVKSLRARFRRKTGGRSRSSGGSGTSFSSASRPFQVQLKTF